MINDYQRQRYAAVREAEIARRASQRQLVPRRRVSATRRWIRALGASLLQSRHRKPAGPATVTVSPQPDTAPPVPWP